MQARYQDRRSTSCSPTWRRMQQAREFLEDNIIYVLGDLVWQLSSFGNFSISSAYEALRPRMGTTLSSECTWATGIPSKISVFMWKLLRRLLPFPDVIERFGICMPLRCPLCLNACATLEHCPVLCSKARIVWIHFVGFFGLSLSSSASVRATCHSWWLLPSSTSAVRCIVCLLPCLILWFIWIAYNECLHDGSTFSPSGLIKRISRESRLIFLATSIRGNGSSDSFLLAARLIVGFDVPPRMQSIWVKWIVPPSGRLKLNTDASFSLAGAAGGACLRDSRGGLVVGLCFNLSASSALEAEACALRLALQWCEAMVLLPALVEVDSQALAHLVSSTAAAVPWRMRDAVYYARACISSWNSSIRHVYREANQVADALAAVGLNAQSSTIYYSISSLPVNVKVALMYDSWGFATHRNVRRQ
ncbi:PREDICTED: uncharacterized protein LOC109172951 [Ipomoea nil]|uniref:uncharacterized protein LOC109172951 n=1 Tax=Ipomoea nil TaxID=35883 RepID=UPI0009017D25|nr:PREDICTED: uncharacterized protein LOC109172951 [Ipomoea nil]